MTKRFQVQAIAAVAAAVAGIVEAVLAVRGDAGIVLMLPLAIGTAALVVVMVLAFDALARRGARPDRADIRAVVALQRRIAGRIDEADIRLARTNDALFLLVLKPILAATDRALDAAAERVERWEDPAGDLTAWREALGNWSAAVARLSPALAPDLDAPDADERRSARARLPMTRNFSSEDLAAATTYYVQSARLVAARARREAYIAAALEAIDGTASTPR